MLTFMLICAFLVTHFFSAVLHRFAGDILDEKSVPLWSRLLIGLPATLLGSVILVYFGYCLTGWI